MSPLYIDKDHDARLSVKRVDKRISPVYTASLGVGGIERLSFTLLFKVSRQRTVQRVVSTYRFTVTSRVIFVEILLYF